VYYKTRVNIFPEIFNGYYVSACTKWLKEIVWSGGESKLKLFRPTKIFAITVSFTPKSAKVPRFTIMRMGNGKYVRNLKRSYTRAILLVINILSTISKVHFHWEENKNNISPNKSMPSCVWPVLINLLLLCSQETLLHHSVNQYLLGMVVSTFCTQHGSPSIAGPEKDKNACMTDLSSRVSYWKQSLLLWKNTQYECTAALNLNFRRWLV
jgi:hypothetical protein